MSFSILTLPVPLTASQQVYNTFQSNVDTASLEGRLIPVCILANGVLTSRLMQSGIGLLRGPVNNTTQTTLTANVPNAIALVNSQLDTDSLNFDMVTNTALRYIGTDTPFNRVRVAVHINFYGASATPQQMTFQMRKNGINIFGASQTLFANSGLITANNSTIEAIEQCATNDVFDMTVTNSTSTSPIVIYNISISAVMNFS
jgi:hypothetical protein